MKTLRLAGALIIALILTLHLTACSDDDETDYADFVVGTWDAESMGILDNEPHGEYYFTYTFKADGTGYSVHKDSGTLNDQFRYAITSFDRVSEANIDFYIDLTVIDENGGELSKERLAGKKTGNNTWYLTDDTGIRKLYLMHRK